MFQPVRKSPPLTKLIVQQIEDKIINRHLSPGERLPSESDLAKEFRCSRVTIREALKILEGIGLVGMKKGSNGGPFVNGFNAVSISEHLYKILRLAHVSINHLTQFRLAIEPAIVHSLAVEGVSKDLIVRLEKNIQHTKKLYEKGQTTRYRNMEFHVLLAEGTNNALFVVIMQVLKANLDRIAPMLKKHEGDIVDNTVKYHESVFKAILDRKPKRAKEEMTKHLIEVQEVLRKKIGGTHTA
jgi:GntR family transcriptional regulator, transcriptional repressor for pyruvate dehydrogenase complex